MRNGRCIGVVILLRHTKRSPWWWVGGEHIARAPEGFDYQHSMERAALQAFCPEYPGTEHNYDDAVVTSQYRLLKAIRGHRAKVKKLYMGA